METKDIYTKLDIMSEQISQLRETAARTEAHLDALTYLKNQVEMVRTQQSQWKGAMLVISAIFSILATLISRMLLK